jgi:hypothetical protein
VHANGKIHNPFLEHQMSVWQRLVALFRFDFRSAFGSLPSLPAPDSGLADEVEQTSLPYELNVQRLDYIRYRRTILDWRDEFSVQMLTQGKDFFRQFSEHVENEVDDVGVFRKLFAKPAADVLEDDFFTLVRAPLVDRAKAAETELTKVIQCLPPIELPALSLAVDEVDPLLSVLGDLRFRPSNQDELLAKLL